MRAAAFGIIRHAHFRVGSLHTLGTHGCAFHITNSLRGASAAFSSSTKHITSLNLEDDFHKVADESLERMSDFLSPLEDDDDVELEVSMGVLKLRVNSPTGSKSWVINKQTPNRQLWWSSPISGPRRYEWQKESGVSDDLSSIRNWTHTRAIAAPGGSVDSTKAAKGEGDLLNQIHSEVLSVTGIDLLKP